MMAYNGNEASSRHRACPHKAAPIRLPRDITVRLGFATIMRGTLDHLSNNQVAALNGGGAECIHQIRVALRRMNATLALFKDVIASPGLAAIKQDLKWLSSRLGAARDWDVFDTRTLQKLQHHSATQAAAERITKAVSEERRAADHRAIRALRSARYSRFIRTVEHWIANERWHERLDLGLHPMLDEPLVEVARQWLHRSARRARKDARGVAHLKAKQRHRLRIALKQLRYDTDSLSSLYARSNVKTYVMALCTLQDVLGHLNDLVVARRLVRSLEGRDSATIDKRLKAAKRRQLKALPLVWRSFQNSTPFWKSHRMSSDRRIPASTRNDVRAEID